MFWTAWLRVGGDASQGSQVDTHIQIWDKFYRLCGARYEARVSARPGSQDYSSRDRGYCTLRE